MSAAALKERLRADLKTAMRERNPAEVSLFRNLIAVIDNAEAVPIEGLEERLRLQSFGFIGKVTRRELDPAELDALLFAEVRSRLSAATDYERHGRSEDAARLRREAGLITRYRA